MSLNEFLANLARILAHSMLLESKGEEPIGVAWAVNGLGQLLNEEPEVPKITPINPQKIQRKTTLGNIANFGASTDLAKMFNLFQQEQMASGREAALPGFADMQGTITAGIEDKIAGNISKDSLDAMRRNAAGAGISGGFGFSGRTGSMGTNRLLRDIGTTTEAIRSEGLSRGASWLAQGQAMMAPQYNLYNDMFSVGQGIDVAFKNQENQFNRDWLNNQKDAAYDARTIIGNNISAFEEKIIGAGGSVLGSYAGGAMGGGGGGAAAASGGGGGGL